MALSKNKKKIFVLKILTLSYYRDNILLTVIHPTYVGASSQRHNCRKVAKQLATVL